MRGVDTHHPDRYRDPVSAPASPSFHEPVGADPLRQRLVAAASEVFAEKGYGGAGVAEIARRAGVTTGAIYSRYRGKDELLAEAIEGSTSDELDRLFTDHRFEGRMEDILRIAGSHLVARSTPTDEVDRRAPGLLLESFVAARREPALRAFLRQRMLDRRSRLADIVAAAQADGGIDPDLDTESLVTFCHAVALGFLLLEVLDPPLPDPADWEALIGRLLSAVGDPSAFDEPPAAPVPPPSR
jgi:AcrR family transcriptional regulator